MEECIIFMKLRQRVRRTEGFSREGFSQEGFSREVFSWEGFSLESSQGNSAFLPSGSKTIRIYKGYNVVPRDISPDARARV